MRPAARAPQPRAEARDPQDAQLKCALRKRKGPLERAALFFAALQRPLTLVERPLSRPPSYLALARLLALLHVEHLVAKLVRFVEKVLLLRRILFGVRLHPEQD